jgi:hypothetical protein
MELIDHIVGRLETRRAAVDHLKCNWYSCCMHVIVRDPKANHGVEVIWLGEDGCRQPIKSGIISECIADLRADR